MGTMTRSLGVSSAEESGLDASPTFVIALLFVRAAPYNDEGSKLMTMPAIAPASSRKHATDWMKNPGKRPCTFRA
jgi:hypothetical protein